MNISELRRLEEAASALASERAAHAETKRELADYQRATNTVDAHETANVRDKPEGQQEPVVEAGRRALATKEEGDE